MQQLTPLRNLPRASSTCAVVVVDFLTPFSLR